MAEYTTGTGMQLINNPKPIIDTECNGYLAFNFNQFPQEADWNANLTIGHLVKLAIPSINKVLNQDITVRNPIHPEIEDSITGVIEYIGWGKGIAEDSGWYGVAEKNDWDVNAMRIQAQLSPETIKILRKTFNVLWSELSDKVTIEIELVVYKYDAVNGYYKQFYTIKPLVLQSVNQIKFTESTDYKLLESSFYVDPVSCILQASVVPQNKQVWVCIG